MPSRFSYVRRHQRERSDRTVPRYPSCLAEGLGSGFAVGFGRISTPFSKPNRHAAHPEGGGGGPTRAKPGKGRQGRRPAAPEGGQDARPEGAARPQGSDWPAAHSQPHKGGHRFCSWGWAACLRLSIGRAFLLDIGTLFHQSKPKICLQLHRERSPIRAG